MNHRIPLNAGAIALCALVSLLALSANALDRTAGQITIDTVLDNNLLAVRSDGQVGDVFSTEKIVSIAEANYSLIARYRASSAGLMRIDVFADEMRVYSEGKDADGVWEWAGGEEAPANVYHEGVGALEHGIEFNLFSLAGLRSRGHTLELVGEEAVRGQHYYVVKVTLADGFENFRYVNADTWLVETSRDYRAMHPAIDATKKTIESRYDRWETTDGVTYATRSRDFDATTGELIQTAIVLQSGYNLANDDLDLARTYVPSRPPKATR